MKMIFDLFKSASGEHPDDVKGIRHAILQFVKQELQKAEGGEGANIKGLGIFIHCGPAERHVYEAAVFTEDLDQLQNEIQRISDDYSLDLPSGWSLTVAFDEAFPDDAVEMQQLPVALLVKTKTHFVKQQAKAYLKALSGKTLQPSYEITSAGGKYNIGRDEKAQSDEGYFRTNHIAFPSESDDERNKYISRQHAHIEWDTNLGKFLIFADEGGIPPRNKVKLRSALTEKTVKLHATQIGQELAEGDQIILGESVVLEFSFNPQHHE
ncbi:FHA domain-containing protein [uncultured Pedobacter sp.]|uniref:FHA domain-containing protein n=1 Tax=uncultured Pedobacter sp. TaxID=246139 RepID=UPI0025F12119|nr:FHA domain-containing protein [uncultured Pedobacter sp.]